MGFDDCVSFSFQTFNLYYLLLFTISISLHLMLSKVEAGESITWLPLFEIVWLYNFAV